LMGARSVQEVEQNVAAAQKGALEEDMLEQIQEIADMVPFRPFEEPFGLPFTRDYKGPGGRDAFARVLRDEESRYTRRM